MKKSGVIMLTVLAIGLAVAGPAPRAKAAISNWQKSVMIQSRYSTDFGSASFDQSVDNALADGANYIALVIPLHQSNIYSTDIQTGNDTPTDQALQSGIAYIHGKGAHAVLTIHDDPYDGEWRAFINPSDRTSWFTNYGSRLAHYATIANNTDIEEMVLGTELTSMTSPDYNGSNTANWQVMIQHVRGLYSGALTYSAQHDGGMSDLARIGFWPQLDYIGISAYYGMGNDESVAAIKSQWTHWNNDSIQPIAAKYGKQVIFTEVGYVSKSNGLGDPGSAYSQGGNYDPTLQANAYQALLDYWNGYSYMAGVAFWDWSSDPNAGGAGNTDYTPQHKPAEQVMKQYFTANPSGPTTPTPPATPTTFSFKNTTPAQATVGTTTTVSTTVTATQAAGGVIVDLELYDQSGNRVAQQYYENQNLAAGATAFTVSWKPSSAGTYRLKAGVFTAGWAQALHWNDNVAAIIASTPSTPTPPTNGGGNPTTPPSAANLSVWWPGNNVAVSGVQPFKAVLDGYNSSSYAMYWQVDGGGLNLMGDNNTSAPHKESLVDVSGWNWSPNGQYTINFVAKNTAGAVVAQKSAVITVTH